MGHGGTPLNWRNQRGLSTKSYTSNYLLLKPSLSSFRERPVDSQTSEISTSLPRRLLGSVFPFARWYQRWKVVISINIFLAFAILAFNIAVPAWVDAKNEKHKLYSGDCNTVDRIAVYAHAVINVFGTALFAASNHAMQILASPSRDDIDSSHGHRQTFSIGTHSLKNLKSVNKFRAVLWIILAVSSIPLHMT